MVTILLSGRVLPGRWDDVVAYATEAFDVYEAPGGIRMRLLRDDADGDRFVEVVEYADEVAYEQDQRRIEQDPQVLRLLTRWHALLDGPPRVQVLRETDVPRGR